MKKRMRTCPNCGEDARLTRGTWKFDESGLQGVLLVGVEIIVCPLCGEKAPIIPQVNKLMTTLARAIASKKYSLTGREVRFLRKHIGKTQQEFSELLRVDKTTVSKWENDDDPVGAQSDLLIRYLVLAHDKEARERLEETIQKFRDVRARHKAVGISINPKTLEYDYA